MTDLYHQRLLRQLTEEPTMSFDDVLQPERSKALKELGELEAESQALGRCLERISEEQAAIREGKGGMFDRANSPTVPALAVPPSERASDTPQARRLAQDEVRRAVFGILHRQFTQGPWHPYSVPRESPEEAWARFSRTVRDAYDWHGEATWTEAATAEIREMRRFAGPRDRSCFPSFEALAQHALAELRPVDVHELTGRVTPREDREEVVIAGLVRCPVVEKIEPMIHTCDDEHRSEIEVRLQRLTDPIVIEVEAPTTPGQYRDGRGSWFVCGLFGLEVA